MFVAANIMWRWTYSKRQLTNSDQHSKDCPRECDVCRPLGVVSISSCMASTKFITSVHGWIEEALCPRMPEKEWHQKDCIMDECDKCGVEKLDWCTQELDPTHNQMIDWQSFEYRDLDDTAQQKREKKKGSEESAMKKSSQAIEDGL